MSRGGDFEVFKLFYAKLLKLLPMDDTMFTANLFSCGLLPDDLKAKVQSANTRAERAECFLDRKIQPGLSTGDSASFDRLLDAMQSSEDETVKELAEAILTKREITTSSATDTGPANTNDATALISQPDIAAIQPIIQSKQDNERRPVEGLDATNQLEKRFRYALIMELRGKFVKLVRELIQIFKSNKVDIEELITIIRFDDVEKTSVFSSETVFDTITNEHHLFRCVGDYCNGIYDYDALKILVQASGYEEATKKLSDFTENLENSVLTEIDLMSEHGKLMHPDDFMPGGYKFIIEYTGSKCSIRTKEMVQTVVEESVRLRRGALIFRGFNVGSILFVYEISEVVRSYLLNYKFSKEGFTFLLENKITSLEVDGIKIMTSSPLRIERLAVMDVYEQALNTCNHHIIDLLNPDEIKTYLIKFSLLTRQEREELEVKDITRSIKIDKIISILPRKGAGWWGKFLECLESSNLNEHDELAKALNTALQTRSRQGVDKSNGSHDESCSSPTSRPLARPSDNLDAPDKQNLITCETVMDVVLRRCHTDLRALLNPENIIPHFNGLGLLTPGEMDRLKLPTMTLFDKVDFIISVLPRKGEGWWGKFLSCLENSDLEEHAQLKEKLEQAAAQPKELKPTAERSLQGVDKSTGGHGESCSSPTSRQRSSDYPDAPDKGLITCESLEKEYNDNIQVKEAEKAELDQILKEPKLEVLIQTVNNNEFYAAMLQLENYRASKCTVHDQICGSYSYYFIGHWGEVKVAIVQTGMGNNGAYGSWYETKKAMHFIPNLKYIFAVGVCGGMKGKVALGDVVVSKVIAGYTDLKITDKGWANRSLKNVLTEDNFYQFLSKAETQREVQEKLIFGTVLSAPWLIASIDMQKQLIEELPEAKDAVAFEMEGYGIVQACYGKFINCMVVKGVSDLADKNKKDDWQPTAAKNATHYLKEMVKKAKHIFET